MTSAFAPLLLVLAPIVMAPAEGGQVRVPLEIYNQMVEAARAREKDPRPVPAGYAIGNANVTVTVTSIEERATANITVNLTIRVLENEWVLIPVLPSGTSVSSATVGGANVQLLATPSGLSWSSNKAGVHNMVLVYRVDASSTKGGFALPVPLPRAAATNLTASLPGTGLDVAVIPASGTKTTESGKQTNVQSTVPTSSGVQISWRTPSDRKHAISRARYEGQLSGEAVTWTAELDVELFNNETLTLDLLPKTVTLNEVRVDGRDSAILTGTSMFSTLVKGQGRHKVSVTFQVGVIRDDGPPRVQMQIPAIPVSRFDLTLPGKREVTVTPLSNVTSRIRGNTTTATLHVPMTSTVAISWSEAVPDEVKTEARSNASLYHAVHAEEGVLYVRAMVGYEVTRGETNVLELDVPAGVQVNRVTGPKGGIADWRVVRNRLTVFLDRRVKESSFNVNVEYDRSIKTGDKAEKVTVPLLQAVNVHRQRGMIALLSNKELTLKPVTETGATRVGENQLPAFVREAVEMTIAHTYKYVEGRPSIEVEATPPERKQGKFDAQVNTLISLGDVTMKGSATIELNVKSGSINELKLELPEKVNVLSLAAPSLRVHKVEAKGGKQEVDVQFTQEMEGQFRIDMTYERIMADTESDVAVPTVKVAGAEVEQGRIAVEALSAVEVQASGVSNLSSLDPSELPQQLILKTTNPILLAYKYVHVDPPYSLSLKITRHREIDVQSATIDRASYQTLFTRDGFAVTTAIFTVRNSRKQFLRVQLPSESKVWAAFVNGQPEKPALAETDGDKGGAPKVLIKIINSAQGFPVTLIYQTPVSHIRALGKIGAQLPRPDMIVTTSQWNVYLPDDLSYGNPDSNMKIIQQHLAMNQADMRDELQKAAAAAGGQVIEPLRITVPAAGLKFVFEKLYANQSDEDATFSIPYASGNGAIGAQALGILGMLMLLVAGWLLRNPPPQLSQNAARGITGVIAVVGIGFLWATIGYLGASPFPTLIALVVALVCAIAYFAVTKSARVES